MIQSMNMQFVIIVLNKKKAENAMLTGMKIQDKYISFFVSRKSVIHEIL